LGFKVFRAEKRLNILKDDVPLKNMLIKNGYLGGKVIESGINKIEFHNLVEFMDEDYEK